MRDMLLDSIQEALDNKTTWSEVSKQAAIVRQLIATVDLEMRIQKHVKVMGGETEVLKLALPSVQFGTDNKP